jgi:hypothetical protein
VFVALSRLKKSPKNVPKVPHTKTDIKAFAASIATRQSISLQGILAKVDGYAGQARV